MRLLTLTLLLGLSAPVAVANPTEFYVSPKGNDKNPGLAARPFRTIYRAQEAVRELRRRVPDLTDTVFVMLRDGNYSISAPLQFGPEDGGTLSSPTVYSASPGDRPVVSGECR
jgi:hypothetical protein